MSEQRLRVQLREKDDIIRDQQEQIDRLRKQLTRLQIGKETMERKQEYTGKSTKKTYEEMEPIYRKLKEKDPQDWEDIRRYLKTKLVDEQGNVDEYKIREMMDYLNGKVFQVFGGIGKGRQTLVLLHNDDQEPFTLTLTKSNKKGRYTIAQQLENVSKAIDVRLHPSHGKVSTKTRESEMSSDPEELSPPSTTKAKMTAFRWYRIDNNNDEEDSSYPEKCNQGGGSGGWRRITNMDKKHCDSLSSSDSN